MAPRDSDDALSWGGDDDATLHTGAADAPKKPTPPERAITKPPPPSKTTTAEYAAVPPAPVSTSHGGPSSVALIALGLLGGIMLLSSIGWIVGGLRLRPFATGAGGLGIDPVGYAVTMWVAVLAPVIWFGSVYFLTRGSRPWLRFVLLIAGILLLLPWPFLMLGVIGR